MERKTRIRGRAIWSALVLASLMTVALAGAAMAKNPIVHQVSAGGPDACSSFGAHPGCDGNYSFTAKLFADGTVKGEYTDRFARGDGIHAVIDCLAVDGNQAWISGWIISGRAGDFDLAGLPFSTRVVDNGKSSRQPPDEISTSHTGDPTSCSVMAQFELFPTPQGQVTVK